MNVKHAAVDTLKLLDKMASDYDSKYHMSRFHLTYMLGEIIHERVTGDKAHRWLGWAQAGVYAATAATLYELKDINHRS
jgi:uncharacterized membrane protein